MGGMPGQQPMGYGSSGAGAVPAPVMPASYLANPQANPGATAAAAAAAATAGVAPPYGAGAGGYAGAPAQPAANPNLPPQPPQLGQIGTHVAQSANDVTLQQQLRLFWEQQQEELEALVKDETRSENATDFKNHNDLPLARIKRIMKSDEDVRMIRAEAPVLFAKACELFILELTLRAYCFSEKTERRNLQKEDIFTAVRNTDIFDFLEVRGWLCLSMVACV